MIVVYLTLQPLMTSSGTGGGGWVHLKGANSMTASGLGCGKALVGTGWASYMSLLLCMNWLRKHSA